MSSGYSVLFDKCEAYALGKQHKSIYPKHEGKRAQTPLELVLGDLVGPMQTHTLGGNVYFSLLTDDFSQFSWAYFMQNKSEAL